jgi:hypothetical protein
MDNIEYWLDRLYQHEGHSRAYRIASQLVNALELFYGHGFIEEPEYDRLKQQIISRIKRQIGYDNA